MGHLRYQVEHYKYFENEQIIRILFTLIILSITNSEFKKVNVTSFKKTIRYMMIITLFGEITSFSLMLFNANFTNIKHSYQLYLERIIHKSLVDLPFITFNCSVCYGMAQYLKASQTTLLRIWYTSITFTSVYDIRHICFCIWGVGGVDDRKKKTKNFLARFARNTRNKFITAKIH